MIAFIDLFRLSGKKGVRQLSIFEVAIIIALGSATGDPMFNNEFAILPSLLVFVITLAFHRALTYFASKNEKFENVLEGEAVYIIEDGMMSRNYFSISGRYCKNWKTPACMAGLTIYK